VDFDARRVRLFFSNGIAKSRPATEWTTGWKPVGSKVGCKPDGYSPQPLSLLTKWERRLGVRHPEMVAIDVKLSIYVGNVPFRFFLAISFRLKARDFRSQSETIQQSESLWAGARMPL
jgi:hypothetical protein